MIKEKYNQFNLKIFFNFIIFIFNDDIENNKKIWVNESKLYFTR